MANQTNRSLNRQGVPEVAFPPQPGNQSPMVMGPPYFDYRLRHPAPNFEQRHQRHWGPPAPDFEQRHQRHWGPPAPDFEHPGAQASMYPNPVSGQMNRLPPKRPTDSIGDAGPPNKMIKHEAIVEEEEEDQLNVLKRVILIACDSVSEWSKHEAYPADIEDVISSWKSLLEAGENLEPEQHIAVLSKRLNSDVGVAQQANALFARYNALMVENTKAMSPSEFAKPEGWAKFQAISPILCLRPPTAIGLPVQILYDGFRKFELNISRTDLNITPEARVAAAVLCGSMGDSFEDKTERSDAIDKALGPMFPGWTHRHELERHAGHAFGFVDWAAFTDYLIGLLAVDEWEFTSDSSDGYMRMARIYDLYARSMCSGLTSNSLAAYLAAGAPAFLVVIQGPMMMICGGFYDGRMTIVEPLTNGIMMLRGYTGEREEKLTRVLTALKMGHKELLALAKQPEPQPPIVTFPPCTPRLYQECCLFDSTEVAGLRFKECLAQDGLGAVNSLIFLATLHRKLTSPPIEDVIVKILPNYGAEVHQYLATEGLAPKLYAFSHLEGILTAHVMERLPPQWITLHSLETYNPHVLNEHSQKIDIILRRVLTLLKDKGLVHGDFRPNNIMIDRDTLEKEGVANIKIVEFDWSGKANKALYPGSRDRTIFWPAGLPGGPIEQEDDTMLFQSWWHHTF